MTFRRVLLVLHLWAALLAGLFLLLLGATGSFMVSEKEVDHVLNRSLGGSATRVAAADASGIIRAS